MSPSVEIRATLGPPEGYTIPVPTRQEIEDALDEMAFRYNNRRNAHLFRDTLMKLVGADSLSYARYFVARNDINAGEEITCDYSIDNWGDVWWRCECGSARCRKTVYNDFFRLPLELQIEYLPYLTQAYRQRFRQQVEELEQKAACP